ncbi:helix-turn-helix domain-containing protein [Fructobacillus sp. M1-13]|uniref:Helix-turn-helix transcriptional regulator n=1 Tax=Fructobacillus papyriferae TaxID=2713171 RepID=A0ABS5QQC4_9LACO|nr:helix-turn-helix transcriptional regulator [Fructobacillus papyriferae]MBS9335361.1 helix-turn-helix transcriptional regulator [Fructobacillus papyriferae]MCD2158971.1 helix-turn-helix domain-containing protein [Fructobacillus papyriferae]
MSIYEKVKVIAKERKISIRELEKKLGFPNGTIQKWDNNANLDKLKKVANFFNVTTDYLLDNGNAKTANLEDLNTIMMFEGKPISDEDKETIIEILRRLRIARNSQ